MKNIAIIGANGAIGRALINEIDRQHPNCTLHAFSRQAIKTTNDNILSYEMDYLSETSIKQCAHEIVDPLDTVVVAIGVLHDKDLNPEKSIKDLSKDNFTKVYEINTIAPALIAKHFLPKLNKKSPTLFAVLSARVGSISDNRLGGWYAYRASKAALNMIIKNLAIETKRTHSNATIIGLHPGTVDSHLSSPFKHNVDKDHLFLPEKAARQLFQVISKININQSGHCIDWGGKIIDP